ncbi:Na-translocating system protein MpsC family protein [cf. Phormidesmis sp. LEGE 11477]|uniref:Na-translocating system protein MpsC family protein n=1 Tax=cf. Phormidesmis sp. LEGE 11477 TaxID=1828680 RepID=UPI0018806D29|nr:Na-translocating system protein MpsC family protein [cf. Phormidesmis sp. LEGE 11477]MBE9060443.1 DUF2294 family protein [cf. Phormidesmis sp. LEGE 11477]
MQEPTSSGDKADRLFERLALEKTALEGTLIQSSGSNAHANNASFTENRLPITDELLKSITAAIEQLYKERLGQPPQQVSCDLLDSRLVIWVEGSITPVERLLFLEKALEAQRVCFTVDRLMHRQLVSLIERRLNVRVVTMVADTCYEQGCTGLIAKLSSSPIRENR